MKIIECHPSYHIPSDEITVKIEYNGRIYSGKIKECDWKMKIINICGEYYWVTPLGEKLYPNLGIEASKILEK